MNSKERFYATLEYNTPDRPATKHYGTPEINQALMQYFGVSSHAELLLKVGDDFRHVEPRYIGPPLRTFPDGSWEGLWGERYANWSFGGGTYPEAIYLPFANITEPADLPVRPTLISRITQPGLLRNPGAKRIPPGELFPILIGSIIP